MERTLTRAERSKLNREKHARERAKLEARWAEEAQAKRDEKRRRREANRRAWWARYGMQAPAIEQDHETEQDDPFSDLRDNVSDPISEAFAASEVEQPSADEWRITGKDGQGYQVNRVYRVTMQGGESFDLPTASDAVDFVRMAVEANREAGAAQWTEGARKGGYTVERATKSRVAIRHDSGKVTGYTPRVDLDGRAYVVLKARNERRPIEIRLYADEMAA